VRHILLRIGAGLLALAGLALAVFWHEIPAWRSGGTNSLPERSVAFDPADGLCPLHGQVIELRGDSIVVGGSMGPGDPYGAVMAQQVGREVKAALNGKGGATVRDGEAGLRAAGAKGAIVLLAYGTNDAALRGWIGGKTAVPLPAFRASLARQIGQLRQAGAQVALIAPPPAGSPAMNARLQPYREAVAAVGREQSVRVFDPADAFSQCSDEEPLLGYDALHPNARGHACIGRWLAQELCP
jgi:lysophospholipase L1-like esterase